MALLQRLKAGILLFTTLVQHPGADRAKVERAVLYTLYGSDIQARLPRIHAHPQRDGPDGMLVVALYGPTPAHVGCAFTDKGERVLCEAIAGAYPPERDAPPPAVSAETEAALKKSGYWRDEASGRFLFPYDIGPRPDESDWGGLSASMLGPLIDVFGARALSKIEIMSPLAPG